MHVASSDRNQKTAQTGVNFQNPDRDHQHSPMHPAEIQFISITRCEPFSFELRLFSKVLVWLDSLTYLSSSFSFPKALKSTSSVAHLQNQQVPALITVKKSV